MQPIFFLLSWWLASTAPLPAIEPVSYARDIVPIMETKCAVKSCHDGSVQPNLATHAEVKAEAKRIRKRVNDRIIPMPPRYAREALTDTEKTALLAWIAAGSPNN